jgi:very-short-patch-repair endonuclease
MTADELREVHRRGGRKRAAMPDAQEARRRGGLKRASQGAMSEIGRLGARSYVSKYGYASLRRRLRDWRLDNPTSGERAVIAYLDARTIQYQREVEIFPDADHPYFVDFLVDNKVIEVNGAVHTSSFFAEGNPKGRTEYDQTRQRWLEKAGYRVLILNADAIDTNAIDAFLVEVLRKYCRRMFEQA